jgi:hypothetical protein
MAAMEVRYAVAGLKDEQICEIVIVISRSFRRQASSFPLAELGSHITLILRVA